MSTPKSFSDLIGEWGIAQFASDLDLTYSTANAMRQRNSIPPRYWSRVLAKAQARDIACSASDLMAMSECAKSERVKRRSAA